VAGRCPDGDQNPRLSIWPVRTVIATGEAAGGAAALTAGPECTSIKRGIGEGGSQCTWSVDGYQSAAGCPQQVSECV
jgi:hypothetical protein